LSPAFPRCAMNTDLIIDTVSMGDYFRTMSYIAERRQEEKERRRGEILDAAEEVAAEVGWETMTMDEVARKARLSRALLYVYFTDKTDLMFGIAERGIETLRQRFEEAVSRQSRGLEQMQEIGRAYVAFSQEFPVYFDVLARCELISSEATEPEGNVGACAAGAEAVHKLMAETLETGVRDGSIRGDTGDVKVVAMVLKGFMHGVIQLSAAKASALARDGIDTRSLLDEALVLATRALAAPKS
jgi:AcrR family transcriptional regulator